MNKQFKNISIKSEELENRIIRFLGTDETQDRGDDVMTFDGWEIGNYMKNPVFLWAHNYDNPPIGKAVNIQFDNDKKGLIFDIEFVNRDIYPFADTIYKLYKSKYLNAVSVGFMPKEMGQDEKNKEVRKINKKELLELSAVPVPANPNALQMSMKKAINDNVINEQEYIELLETLKNYKFEKEKTEDKPKEKVLPIPNDDETEREFLGRCMSDETMISEYPDNKQRTAVCYQQYDGKEQKINIDNEIKEYKKIYSNLFSCDKSKELLSQDEINSIKNIFKKE